MRFRPAETRIAILEHRCGACLDTPFAACYVPFIKAEFVRRTNSTLMPWIFRPKGENVSLRRRSERGTSIRGRQTGAGKLKAILVTLVIAFGAYAAFKIVPVYSAEYQLRDKLEEQARFSVVNHYSEDQIKDIIYKEIQDLDIPAKRDDIHVMATMSTVKISVTYSVPVDLLFFHTVLNFNPSSEGKSLTA